MQTATELPRHEVELRDEVDDLRERLADATETIAMQSRKLSRLKSSIESALFEFGELGDSQGNAIGDHDSASLTEQFELWPQVLSDTDRMILARAYEFLTESID